jgi:hypothetical protein
MAGLRAPVFLACLCALATTPALAAFQGVPGHYLETFDGTAKDQSTWLEIGNASPPLVAFAQNDALSIAIPPTFFGYGAYLTTQAKVRTGGSVRANVTVTGISSLSFAVEIAYLGLTADPSVDPYASSRLIDLEASFDSGVAFLANEDSATAGGSGTQIIGAVPQLGVTYSFELDRLTSTSFSYSVYNAAGALLGATTRSLSNVPSDLYVALGARNVKVTLDNVLLTGNVVVPEPAGLSFLASFTLLGRARRRRRRRVNSETTSKSV